MDFLILSNLPSRSLHLKTTTWCIYVFLFLGSLMYSVRPKLFFKFFSFYPTFGGNTCFYKLENKHRSSKIILKYLMFGRKKFGISGPFMMETNTSGYWWLDSPFKVWFQYRPIWVWVSDLNQNSGFCGTLS